MKIKVLLFTLLLFAVLILAEGRSGFDESMQLQNITNLNSNQTQLTESSKRSPIVKDPPNGFRKIGSKYYYIEVNEKMNWISAAIRCHELGGHLASVQNKQEHEDLRAQLSPNRDYWIDINDIAKEGQFMSLTTGRAAPYLSWVTPANPDNWNNQEHCVHLYNYYLFMNDNKCDALFNFICESFDE